MHIDIAAVTSKGQFTIPLKFRELLRLSAGSKMIIACDGEHLLLKPVKAPDLRGFRQIIQKLRIFGAGSRRKR